MSVRRSEHDLIHHVADAFQLSFKKRHHVWIPPDEIRGNHHTTLSPSIFQIEGP